jgi:hypothetical protein
VDQITSATLPLVMQTMAGEMSTTQSSLFTSYLERFFLTGGFRMAGCIPIQFHVDVIEQSFVALSSRTIISTNNDKKESPSTRRYLEEQQHKVEATTSATNKTSKNVNATSVNTTTTTTTTTTIIEEGALYVNVSVALEYRFTANGKENNQLAHLSRLLALFLSDRSDVLVNMLLGSKQSSFMDVSSVGFTSKHFSELVETTDMDTNGGEDFLVVVDEIDDDRDNSSLEDRPLWMHPFVLTVVFTVAAVFAVVLCTLMVKVRRYFKS